MSDTTNNPQPSEPPVGGSGTGTVQTEPPTDPEPSDAEISDPPTSGSGGGSK